LTGKEKSGVIPKFQRESSWLFGLSAVKLRTAGPGALRSIVPQEGGQGWRKGAAEPLLLKYWRTRKALKLEAFPKLQILGKAHYAATE
jgi:hypothetical protein